MSDLRQIFSHNLLNRLGIVEFGVTSDPNAASYPNFKEWLTNKKNADLKYLENEKMRMRESISHYFPEFKSAIVFLFDYAKEKRALERFYQTPESNGFKIGSYTLIDDGVDYHYSIREKLNILSSELKKYHTNLNTVFSLDTQPILERDLAYRAGLGWFGRNSMLINKKYGSFFLIGAILCDQEFLDEIKFIEPDHCGTCTACVDACPTDAIDYQTRTVESAKCVPYFTIEKFKDDSLPPQGFDQMGEIFGCDICQDVCPWNKKILLRQDDMNEKINSFIQHHFLEKSPEEMMGHLEGLSKKGYRREFSRTSFERTGRDGILKNLKYKK